MLKRTLLLALATLALGSFLVAIPACSESDAGDQTTANRPDDAAVYGPYATIRRANEVANYYRNQGYQAITYHNGDGYYVKVW